MSTCMPSTGALDAVAAPHRGPYRADELVRQGPSGRRIGVRLVIIAKQVGGLRWAVPHTEEPKEQAPDS